MNHSDFQTWVQRKDDFMRSARSPLLGPARTAFQGLAYFPYNANLEVRAVLELDAKRETSIMATTDGSVAVYERVGWFSFGLEGAQVRLAGFVREGSNVDQLPETLFVPFQDASNRLQTYPGGRYLEVQVVQNSGAQSLVEANFNLAYNPFCAYGEGWACPIPPLENRLQLPVRAGELNFDAGSST